MTKINHCFTQQKVTRKKHLVNPNSEMTKTDSNVNYIASHLVPHREGEGGKVFIR